MLSNSIDANVGVFSVLFLVVIFVAYFIYEQVVDFRKSILSNKMLDADPVIFLFDQTRLIDATISARNFLKPVSKHQSDWQALIANFTSVFPDLESKIQNLDKSGAFVIASETQTDASVLKGELINGITRLTYTPDQAPLVSHCNLTALEGELATLRSLTNTTQTPCWVEDSKGKIYWANAAYFSLIETTQPKGTVSTWPPISLFPHTNSPAKLSTNTRIALTCNNNTAPLWFRIDRHSKDDHVYCFATQINDTISAENSLNTFRETLTKTFATLTVGLAVFDKTHRLVMFNPSLVDLTSIPFESLSSKPSMYEFFDMLRELRIVPEKKDFSDWRQHVSLLEDVADNSIYQETWTLPSGQVFRFTGQPQLDGAIALFLDDISAEISLSRSYRAELKLNQTVLDHLTTSVVVFSPMGFVAISNNCYADLWGVDPNHSLSTLSFQDLIGTWRSKSNTPSDWDQIETALFHNSNVCCEVRISHSNTPAIVKVQGTPLSDGSYMIQFSLTVGNLLENSSFLEENHITT